MNFDISQFDNLELNDIGQWPPIAKLVLTIFFSIVVFGLGYVLLISDKLTQLDAANAQETKLKQQYKTKYHVAANLELFKKQMISAQNSFAAQLKSLPESHETPGLLDDITFVGTTSGLNFVNISWQPENSKDIYVELPIEMEVIGTYHEFGEFVSKIAGLPRIVTVHDFSIEHSKSDTKILDFKLHAKTYRYQEVATK